MFCSCYIYISGKGCVVFGARRLFGAWLRGEHGSRSRSLVPRSRRTWAIAIWGRPQVGIPMGTMPWSKWQALASPWRNPFGVDGLVAINFLFSQKYWEFHHPNWRTLIFFRGVAQPPTRFWGIWIYFTDIDGSIESCSGSRGHGQWQFGRDKDDIKKESFGVARFGDAADTGLTWINYLVNRLIHPRIPSPSDYDCPPHRYGQSMKIRYRSCPFDNQSVLQYCFVHLPFSRFLRLYTADFTTVYNPHELH